jgi:hypothetical protein
MMARIKKSRQHATKVEAPEAEAPVVETTAVESQETPAAEAPAVVVEETPAKPAKKRYANIAVLANPNAIITHLVQPNPKRDPNSKTYRKYALFKVGMSVKEVEEAFVANNWPRMKARNQLRWDIEHGYVELGIKEESQAETPAEA